MENMLKYFHYNRYFPATDVPTLKLLGKFMLAAEYSILDNFIF